MPPIRRALVTGGAGFLGSHMCARLLQEGFSVVALDNLVTGNLQNLEGLRGRDAFQFVKQDVSAPVDLEADYIFDFAGLASPRCRRDAEEHVATRAGGVHPLHPARHGSARGLEGSASPAYGPETHPRRAAQRGNASARGRDDDLERCAEALLFDCSRPPGVVIKVARIFDSYGPQMRLEDGRVVAKFIVQALRNEPLTIHGDGSQAHSPCYVDDLIDGVFRLTTSAATPPGPVDFGDPGEFTVLQLAERILALTGSRSRLVRRPMPLEGGARVRPDLALARDVLGWQPRIGLDDGLKRTIAYFEQALANEVPQRGWSAGRA